MLHNAKSEYFYFDFHLKPTILKILNKQFEKEQLEVEPFTI